MKIKGELGQLKRNILMFLDYIHDYRLYKKYNFGNYKNIEHKALESRIIRQTHILEKGMSLSSPRVGFGQEKIRLLFEYLDDYREKGGSIHSFAFENAISTLQAYVAFFQKTGYHNENIESKIASYEMGKPKFDCGVQEMSWEYMHMMSEKNFPEFLASRHSVRQFSDRNIDVSVIEDAVRLARRSPSACNRQSAKVYMFTDKATNDEIGKTLVEGNNGFAQEVNKYLVITGDRMAFSDSYERNQYIIDASLFAMNLVLALHYYGIGSCILQSSERRDLDKKRHKVLDIPEHEKIVLFIAIGYYKEKFHVAKSARKDVEEILFIK